MLQGALNKYFFYKVITFYEIIVEHCERSESSDFNTFFVKWVKKEQVKSIGQIFIKRNVLEVRDKQDVGATFNLHHTRKESYIAELLKLCKAFEPFIFSKFKDKTWMASNLLNILNHNFIISDIVSNEWTIYTLFLKFGSFPLNSIVIGWFRPNKTFRNPCAQNSLCQYFIYLN